MNTRESDFWNERSGPRIAPEHFGDIVATAADMALVVGEGGRIVSVMTNPLNSGLGRIEHWEGRDIRDFLAPDSIPKVERQLAAVASGQANRPDAIEVNHSDGARWDFPIRYTVHLTGRDGRMLMLGRDLRPIAELQQRLVRAQQALEKDHESQRIFETRYRVILESVRDPLVLVDAESGRVLDLNRTAAKLMGGNVQALVGSAFTQAFEGRRRAEFMESLTGAATRDTAEGVHVSLRQGEKAVTLRPSLFRNAGERVLLCRLDLRGDVRMSADPQADRMSDLYHGAPEGIAFTDADDQVVQANDAFLSLVDVDNLSQVKGSGIADFLGRGAIDLDVLVNAQAPRALGTRLRSAFGSQRAVEITATRLPHGGHAFVIRDGALSETVRDADTGTTGPDDRSIAEATAMVGSLPLRDIVASMTDVVEKRCIEAAVELTGNNRVAAAEMLGLSRQSLYVKLRKYGIVQRDEL